MIKRFVNRHSDFHLKCQDRSVQEISILIAKDLASGIVPDYVGGFLGACITGNLDVVKLLISYLPKQINFLEDFLVVQPTTIEYVGIYSACMYAQFNIIEYLFALKTFSQLELDTALNNLIVYMNYPHHKGLTKEQIEMRYNCILFLLVHGAFVDITAKHEKCFIALYEYHLMGCVNKSDFTNEDIIRFILLYLDYNFQDFIFDPEKHDKDLELAKCLSNILNEQQERHEILMNCSSIPLDIINLICSFLEIITPKQKKCLFSAKYLPLVIQKCLE
jgi:hypothetical protein